jgi:nucleoside-diphosphate-sugar epimerase
MSADPSGFGGPVLVTGANGFIGRHLCRHLAGAGVDVHAAIRTTSSRHLIEPRAVTVHAVQDSLTEVPALVNELRPTVVFHLATLFSAQHIPTGIQRMVEANVAFGTVVADAAARVGARLVHTSSAWQHYGGAEYSPVSLYAATKQALCDVIAYFVEAGHLEASEVCLFDTYGPDDDRKKLVWLLLEHAASGEPLPMSSGRQLVDLTHVNDVVAALVHVATRPPLASRLVARSGTPLTVRALAGLVEQVTGRPIDVQWGAQPSRPREMDVDWSVPGATSSWRPQIALMAGVAELWSERTRSRE